MKTDLQDTKVSGVFVEFYAADGRRIGQALFADWQGQPVPRVGETFSCPVFSDDRRGVLTGQVHSRHFEVQFDDQAQPLVWVRLELLIATAPRRNRPAVRFSAN